MTTQPTPASPAEVCERLKKIATCIYIAVEAPVADDVSSAIRQAIALISQGEQERERLAASLSDMVDMSETLIKNIAEFSKDPRILTTPSPRLDAARQLLAARAQPSPESK